MFDKPVETKHTQAIERITAKHLQRANLSQRETAWSDCYRLGMDEVTRYCRKAGIPTLGAHMVAASNALQG